MVKKKRQSEPGDDCGESTESCDENVTPTCPHSKKSVDLNQLKKKLKQTGIVTECSDCSKAPESDSPKSLLSELDSKTEVSHSDTEPGCVELWMCLRCGSQLCGRNKNKHALNHYKIPHSDSHMLAVNTVSWDIFCYQCNSTVGGSSTKKLHEVIEYLKKLSTSTAKVNNVDEKKIEAMETTQLTSVFDKSEFVTMPQVIESSPIQRVRGLTNLGNTCFFNSVLQCLVQTPYLTSVLKEMSEPGEKFQLPGGKLKIPVADGEKGGIQEKELDLPPISGELEKWGPLTETLADTLEKLQTPGKSDVFNPSKLFNSFVHKHHQFGTGEQFDSHELLRHLLEAVRNEDLRRYQGVVLKKLDLDSREKRSDLDSEKKQKVKYYGQQASDTMLRPEQVFRGFLVSTLECQDCHHSSNRTEYFLDLSLPVTAEKPQPPAITRRKGPAPEEQISCLGAPDENKPSKHQLKKEKQAARKLRKSKKGGSSAATVDKQNESSQVSSDMNESKAENKSSSEQSDADVEDNLEENPKAQDNINCVQPMADTAANFATYQMESGYNSEKVISSDSIRASPVDLDKEKSDASPERFDKDKDEGISTTYCLSAKAIPLEYSPLSAVDSPVRSNPDSGVASPETAKHTLSETINVESPVTSKDLGSPTSLSSEINMDLSSPRQSNNSPVNELEMPVSLISLAESENHISTGNMILEDKSFLNNTNKISIDKLQGSTDIKLEKINSELDRFKLNEDMSRGAISKFSPGLTLNVSENLIENTSGFDLTAPRLISPEIDSPKWKKDLSPFANRTTTISPRYQCDDGEYSIQSCLNQFTTSELLAGNNKVGCEACTKRANTGKTVYTNATKRFLIASPPAVLILHLKRFQIGPRCMFRKMSKHVNFPVILDLAPFCTENVKTLPNVSPNQTKLLYSLYGVVEHSGSMHGGHYVAYVKVRPGVKPGDKRLNFLPKGGNISRDEGDTTAPEVLVNGINGNDDTDSSMSGYESGEKASGGCEVESPPGKWFYISDSRVQESSEEKVLKTQAYLLFYERIL